MYHAIVFDPLYNGLIGLLDVFPWMDAGVAVIVFTIIIKLILFPLGKKAIVTQVRMKELEPELNTLKAQYSNDKQAQGLKVMELYKEKGVNPFASFFLILIQLPILYALYSIFMSSGLPSVNTALLYSFISAPIIDMQFLSLIDISKPSIIISLAASVAQFFQLHYSLASVDTSKNVKDKHTVPTMADTMQRMTKQMKYIFPVIIFIISYKISAAVALYWAVSNLFTLGQELFVRRKLAQKTNA